MPTIPVDLLIKYGLQNLGAIAIFAIGLILAKWAGNFAYRSLLRQEMEPPIRMLLVRLVKILVLVFTLVVALDQFGVQVAPLIFLAVRCSFKDGSSSLVIYCGYESELLAEGGTHEVVPTGHYHDVHLVPICAISLVMNRAWSFRSPCRVDVNGHRTKMPL